MFAACAIAVVLSCECATDARQRAFVVGPTASEMVTKEEAAVRERRIEEDRLDMESGRVGMVYMVVFKGKDFGDDESKVVVRINGVRANDVMLHNSSALSFSVPKQIVLDQNVLSTSHLDLRIGTVRHIRIPLVTLSGAFEKVDRTEFKQRIVRQREEVIANVQHSKPVSTGGSEGEEDEQNYMEEGNNNRGNEKGGSEGVYGNDNKLSAEKNQDVKFSGDGEVFVHGGGLERHPETDMEDAEAITDSLLITDQGDVTSSNSASLGDDATDTGHSDLEEQDAMVQSQREDLQTSPVPESASKSEMNKKVDTLLMDAKAFLNEDTASGTQNAIRSLNAAIELGSVHAMTMLGALHLRGDAKGLPRDFDLAVPALQAAANKGFPDAQALLGFLHASGIAGTALRKDIGAAVLMWTFAAEGGSTYAKMALGYRYFTGTDVAEDCEKASSYYKDVAREVVREARERFGILRGSLEDDDDNSMAQIRLPSPNTMLRGDRKRLSESMVRHVRGESNDVIRYFRHAADRGDPKAQVMMGNLYDYGAADMPQDERRARDLYERAARGGRPEAHAHLGFMDLRAGSNHSALDHMKKAAEFGEKLGLHGMGYIALHGIGVPRNAKQAAVYFRKAADAKHPESMFNLALMYSNGVGVDKSPDDAYRFFQAAAKFEHMQSNYNVGLMILLGSRPAERKDCTLATRLLKLVAEQGIWNEILSKALRAYERGSYADALYRYLQAAHAGIEVAQFNAAFMYEHNSLSNEESTGMRQASLTMGHSINRHAERAVAVEEALELYQMSAMQDQSDSMVRMGDLSFGEGKDFHRAAMSYNKAVKLKSAEAMFNLGWMHARGFGMAADKHMAKRYFDMAKETDRDAFIPATLAVYALEYTGTLQRLSDLTSTALERARSLFALTDLAMLTLLLGTLVVVVNTRQRRILAAAGREGDGVAIDFDRVEN